MASQKLKAKMTSGGTSSSAPSHKRARNEPDFKIDREDVKALLEAMKKRQIVPTRWVDHTFLLDASLTANFEWMAEHAGLTAFTQIHVPTFERLKRECLSTFHSNILEVDEEQY